MACRVMRLREARFAAVHIYQGRTELDTGAWEGTAFAKHDEAFFARDVAFH